MVFLFLVFILKVFNVWSFLLHLLPFWPVCFFKSSVHLICGLPLSRLYSKGLQCMIAFVHLICGLLLPLLYSQGFLMYYRFYSIYWLSVQYVSLSGLSISFVVFLFHVYIPKISNAWYLLFHLLSFCPIYFFKSSVHLICGLPFPRLYSQGLQCMIGCIPSIAFLSNMFL